MNDSKPACDARSDNRTPEGDLDGIVVYARPDCHLCDNAIQLIRNEGQQPQIINIDDDPVLRERFTNCVPVVQIDGKIRFRGRVQPVLLRRILRHRSD